MATKVPLQVRNVDGTPNTAATLSFVTYRTPQGLARTPPAAPAHVANGWYIFTPSDSDETEGIIFRLSCAGFPKQFYGAIHGKENPLVAVLLLNSVGDLYVGSSKPTFETYTSLAGAARAAPTLNAVEGGYLFSFAPTRADLDAGVVFEIRPPTGALDEGLGGCLVNEQPAVVLGASQAPSPQFPQTIAYAEVSSRDLAARATLGSVATSAARVQSTHQFVRDHAGESFQAAYMIHAPANCPVGLQHRLWLPSEGDTTGVTAQSRRIIKVEKLREGSGAVRFLRIYCF